MSAPYGKESTVNRALDGSMYVVFERDVALVLS